MLFMGFSSMSLQLMPVYPSFQAMHSFLIILTAISIPLLYELLLYLELVLLYLALSYLSTKLI